jgi:hypothetical protein
MKKYRYRKIPETKVFGQLISRGKVKDYIPVGHPVPVHTGTISCQQNVFKTGIMGITNAEL